MRIFFKPTVLAIFFISQFAQAQNPPAVIRKNAVEFDRFEFDDDAKVEWIRKSGNLSGKTPETPADQPGILGWVEYDFSVISPGWYLLRIQPDGSGHEFMLDGKNLYYGNSPTVANLWLQEGKHTLRIHRSQWTGFGKITSWELSPAGEEPEERISVRTTSLEKVIRKGETLPLTVSYGALTAPVKLTLLVRERSKPEVVEKIDLDLSAGGGLKEVPVALIGGKQGIYQVSYQLNERDGKSAGLFPITFTVVDTTPVVASDGEVVKRLITEIDCAKQAPDFFKGGQTRAVNKSWGNYRESGDVGYLQHMNSTDPSWFAYKFKVDDPDALYWMEFEFPDDARRSFLVVPRSSHSPIYAGPGTGPDTGREFSLTNQMQTMGIYFWPNDTDLRVAIMQPQSGLRAAVSKIRIYKVEGDFAPLPHAKNGRDFIHWYEEGSSFMGFFGASNQGSDSVMGAAENWARVMAHMGASVLMPTLSIYQMGLYPSVYNPNFSDSNTYDSARVIELMCEKYGLKFAAEFHPEGREMKWSSTRAKSPDSLYQFNRFGKIWDGGDGPKFNFLNPVVEKFAVDLIGEFADRYGDSPAFDGVSIRLMGWQNTGFGNFDSLIWGYGDFTIRIFEQDTGIKITVPENDPERFEKRYQWLMSNAKSQWIEWRCQKTTEFFAKVRDRVRDKHPNATLFLNDFLTPNPAGSLDWYGNFVDTPRNAGIDPARLASVKGIELLNATVGYGRRSLEDVDQRYRDALLNPAFLGVLKQAGKSSGFLTGQNYFEATAAIAPPQDLGYPLGTPHGWLSGSVNPAGRHYLERFALALAEFDAVSLGDGGNGYTIGQPLLREFLREYRALPQEPFQSRPDARDPVAVWERQRSGDFLFYAVNRERYPVKVNLEFESSPQITRLATGQKVEVDGKKFQIELRPYELRTFAASAGTKIKKVGLVIPEADLTRVRKMTEWLKHLADDVTTGTVGADLSPEQKALLNNSVAEAESCLKEGRYWRARTLQEDQRLREIYHKCGRIPPLLDQSGPLKIPEGAFSGKALISMVTMSKQASLVPSEKISQEWPGQEVVISARGELTLEVEIPVDGKYRLRFGQVVGEGFADSTVSVEGTRVGVLKSSHEPIHGSFAILPDAVSLSKGRHKISLVASDGARQGLIFFELAPVYEDVVANRWMIAGPFLATTVKGKGADAAVEDAMKSRVFTPELTRDFSATLDTFDKPRKWQRQGGMDDYVDFMKLTGQGFGSIHYAVTYIVSPIERDVAVSYSSDYFARMWLNGEIIEDGFHPDGHPEKGMKKRILHLEKGVNELLLKIGAGSGGNGFWFALNNPGDIRFAPMGAAAKPNPAQEVQK